MEPSDYNNSQGYYRYENPDGYQDSEDHHAGFPDAPHDPHEKQKDSKKEEEEKGEQEKETTEEEPDPAVEEMVTKNNRRRRRQRDDKENEEDLRFSSIELEPKITDPVILAQIELIEKSEPTTDLEIALSSTLERKQTHIERLTNEIIKLKQFISKRKQTYKRKRKDDGAPTRALSAYNIFIQDRFAKLAKENEKALTSEDKDAKLKRVPPASLVSSTGNEWKTLSAEVKAQYEERCVGLLFLISRAHYSIFLAWHCVSLPFLIFSFFKQGENRPQALR